jgi:DNA replication protein DnaC
MSETLDATRLTLLLTELRLPATKQMWTSFAERSDKEGWPAARLLMALAENELAERDRRRIERHLGEARLLPGKTLDNFDFNSVPMISKAQVSALCAGDEWLRNGANLLLMGPPGGGKSHLSSAIGLALLEKGWRVLFARTSDLVQRLQVARRELALEAAINRLDNFHLLILDLCAEFSDVKWHVRTGVGAHGLPFSLNITNRTVDPSSTMEGTHAQCHLPQRSRPVRAVSLCGRT